MLCSPFIIIACIISEPVLYKYTNDMLIFFPFANSTELYICFYYQFLFIIMILEIYKSVNIKLNLLYYDINDPDEFS